MKRAFETLCYSSQKEEFIFISMDTETCKECGDDMIYIVRAGSITDKVILADFNWLDRVNNVFINS